MNWSCQLPPPRERYRHNLLFPQRASLSFSFILSPPRKGMFDWAEMIQDAGWALWILQGHTISFALVVKASVNYTPAAFIFEIAGIKGWEGFLGCFIWMFSAGVHFNQGPIPPRPSAKHVADFPVVPLTFMRGILSWKSQRKPSVMVEESICVALINAITTRAR